LAVAFRPMEILKDLLGVFGAKLSVGGCKSITLMRVDALSVR